LTFAPQPDNRQPILVGLAPGPIEASKFGMEQQGLTPRPGADDREAGSGVYEVLAGRRPLAMAIARRLHKQLQIPAGSFLEP